MDCDFIFKTFLTVRLPAGKLAMKSWIVAVTVGCSGTQSVSAALL